MKDPETNFIDTNNDYNDKANDTIKIKDNDHNDKPVNDNLINNDEEFEFVMNEDETSQINK